MLKSITLSNFKTIKDPYKFDIHPITLITGPNNSGKSGLMKAMLLLKENMKDDYIPLKFDFKSDEHKLGDIKSTFSKYATNDIISFELEFESKIDCMPEFVKGGKVKISHNSKGEFVSFEMHYLEDDIYVELLKFESSQHSKSDNADSKAFSGKLVISNFLKTRIKEVSNNLKRNSDEVPKGVSIDNPQKIDYSERFDINDDIFDVFFDDQVKPSKNHKKLEKELLDICDNELFNEHISRYIALKEKTHFIRKNTEIRKTSITNSIAVSIAFINKGGLFYMVPKADGDWEMVPSIDISKLKSVNPDSITDLGFSENGIALLNMIAASINDLMIKASGFVNDISHLNPDKSNQNRAYFTNSGSDNKHLIFNYYNSTIDEAKNAEYERDSKVKEFHGYISARKHFTDKWLRRLGIINENEYFYVKKFGDHTCEGIIGNVVTNQETNIADLGFGTGQLLMLLLKISESEDNILLIEEPESNLHPDFQSKLADIFWDAYKTFKTRFIIETHSEYLIRKIQFLEAKSNSEVINPNINTPEKQAVIYYFNKTGLSIPARIDAIDITTDGRLTKDFGPGFLDESTKIIFDLWNLPGQN